MSDDHILLVEDDDAIALVVETALTREGVQVERASSLAQRNIALSQYSYRLMITDVILPDGNGLHELTILKEHFDIGEIIVLSAQNTLNTAIRAAEEGAFEYLPKPFDLNELVRVAKAALARSPTKKTAVTNTPLLTDAMPLIGRAATMQDVYRTIAKLASNDLSVLILGESGTGKELVAQAIHETGRRKAGPFVAVNMAAIPRDLIESDLFGHEKGAFTGAHARSIGRFEQAKGGTLFLDEIGDMPMDAQTRLLRVLQSGEFVPVGGARSIKADIRIVAATNQDLPQLIKENRFREDLYYRINVIPVGLPPLRDRREDIPALVEHFVRLSVEEGLAEKAFSAEAIRTLSAYNWPGNVRELRNLVQRLLIHARDHHVHVDDVESLLKSTIELDTIDASRQAYTDINDAIMQWLETKAIEPAPFGRLYDDAIELLERPLLRYMMDRYDGNQLRIAEHLGINRNTLRKKLIALSLLPDKII